MEVDQVNPCLNKLKVLADDSNIVRLVLPYHPDLIGAGIIRRIQQVSDEYRSLFRANGLVLPDIRISWRNKLPNLQTEFKRIFGV